jgi:deoxyribonucleoside regulator
MVLALAWGTMLREISDVLMARMVTNCRVVLLNGIGNSRALGEHYSSAILTAFGTAYNAYIRRLPVPVFLDRPETRDVLFAERAVRAVVDLQRDADVALFSLGHVDHGVPSSPYRAGYFLDQQDYRALEEDGVVGDLATTFFRADGSSEGVRMNRRTSGPDLDLVRSIPHRICAVSGNHKVSALRAALLGELATDLVIDEITARELLGEPTLDEHESPDRSRADAHS